MRLRHLLLLVSSGLAICAPSPNPRPIPRPEAEANVDSDGGQITLSPEDYYSSSSGLEKHPPPPPPPPSQQQQQQQSKSNTTEGVFSVKATTSKDDGKRVGFLDREALGKEYDALQELKVKLLELEKKVRTREGWFKEVVCEGQVKVECASPVCAFRKVFTTAAGGLRKRDGERCWERTGREEFPLPPWRGGKEVAPGEGGYTPPGWIKVLNSGVLEVLVIVVGLGLVVLSWGLMRDRKREGDEERQVRRRGCCGIGWRGRGGEGGFEEREKLAGFGEHENEESQEEPEFEIGSDSGCEDGMTGTATYDIGQLQYQQQEEAERRIQTWVPEPGYESENEGMVADGICTVPRPTAGQEDRERQLRDQDLAARQRYAPSESGSDTLAGTRSPSVVDSLEGVSMSQELAAFRDVFGMVEDLVASVEQRRQQI
ncbi:hypothetical protein QBC41DRAFT_62172 [Cercophora samala]|uniref:Uncharacterized protein n=1 Tax=Cercophora samala TaxID=330535 RepID=A0AA39ZHF5_9PEZI|nr:hypothetical protein QBC41DRAFT_62172 [Cercophora samala]